MEPEPEPILSYWFLNIPLYTSFGSKLQHTFFFTVKAWGTQCVWVAWKSKVKKALYTDFFFFKVYTINSRTWLIFPTIRVVPPSLHMAAIKPSKPWGNEDGWVGTGRNWRSNVFRILVNSKPRFRLKKCTGFLGRFSYFLKLVLF
jgi:hypothetical protein